MIEWGPVIIFTGIAFGVLIGLPMAPFYLLAGAVFGIAGLPWVMSALALHFLLSYYLATRWLRPPIQRLIDKFFARVKLPQLGQGSLAQLNIWVRAAPGLPLWAQSYFLSLSGVPWWSYFIVGMIFQAAYAIIFILTGGALVGGQWLWVAGGLVALGLLAWLASRMIPPDAPKK